jgi:hypothetical protein
MEEGEMLDSDDWDFIIAILVFFAVAATFVGYGWLLAQ